MEERILIFIICFQCIVRYIYACFTFYLSKIQPKREESRVILYHCISWDKFILTQVNIEKTKMGTRDKSVCEVICLLLSFG